MLLTLALFAGFALLCRADIQDPPANDYGPTRKLGRGVANLLFGWSELPNEVGRINELEGNSAAAGYGVVRGVGRSIMRIQAGVFEILTFPFPNPQGNFKPLFESDTHWIHAGYKEFPPELGNDSKYPYVRDY